MSTDRARPRVGVVLGAGGARGWAHIGALRELDAMGVPIDVICGCSSGALVAASYAAGRLDALERLGRAMTRAHMLRFFDLSLKGGGLIEGRWLLNFFRANIGDIAIEDAAVRFGAVATEHQSGREIWFSSGSMVDAVRASIALPGLLTPVRLGRRWLLDGALVNPLPITLCRSLGADVIVALNLSGDLAGSRQAVEETAAADMAAPASSWLAWLRGAAPAPPDPVADRAGPRPGYQEVLADALLTMQNFITRMRLAADPPDVTVTLDLAGVGMMEYHKGAQAMALGAAGVRARRDEIRAAAHLPPLEPTTTDAAPEAVAG